MGLNSYTGKNIYKLVKLSPTDVRLVAKYDASRLGHTQAVIDVDCNNVIYNVGSKSPDPIGKLMSFICGLTEDGANVQPICDPPSSRPISKLAMYEHKATTRKGEINAILKHHKLRKINAKLKNDKLGA